MNNLIIKEHDLVGMRFKCTSCKHQTSGNIIPELSQNGRWCPICKKPLIWCVRCEEYREGEILDGKVFCPKCKTDVEPKNYEFNLENKYKE